MNHHNYGSSTMRIRGSELGNTEGYKSTNYNFCTKILHLRKLCFGEKLKAVFIRIYNIQLTSNNIFNLTQHIQNFKTHLFNSFPRMGKSVHKPISRLQLLYM